MTVDLNAMNVRDLSYLHHSIFHELKTLMLLKILLQHDCDTDEMSRNESKKVVIRRKEKKRLRVQMKLIYSRSHSLQSATHLVIT
jgi:hypothetical protein